MSKEGWFIASHSDGTSAIWDKNCNLIKKLEGQTGSIYRCAISSNDSLIATGSREGDIFIWSKKGEFIDSIRPEGKLNITSVKFSNKNPAILAFGSQTGVVGMCNLKTKTRIQKHSHTSLINTVYFNETDELIVTASDDGLLKTFDLELNEKVTYKGHKGVVQFANFMNNNKYILSGGQDGTIYKWPVKLKTILDWKKDAEQKGLIYQLSPEDKIKYGISESN